NVLSITARDQGGSLSEATVVHVSFNLAPALNLITPENNTVLSSTTTLLAKITDENGDRILSRFEALPASSFNKSETEWTLLGETISGKLIFDTTEISDGAYLIRAVADDGATTTISDFRLVTIKNQLPTIKFDDGRRTYTNKNTALVRGSVIAPDIPSRPAITRLEYSTNAGKTWIAPALTEGTTLSNEKRFSVTFPNLSEGSHEILWRATDSRGFSVWAKHPIIIDTVPPKSPAISFPRSGIILSDALDEDRKKDGIQFTVRGTGEPNSTIVIEVVGGSYSTKVSLDGAFRQTLTLKERGTFGIETFSIDGAGNKSPKKQLTVTYNNPPKITFLNPRDGRGVSGITKVSWLLKDPDNDLLKDVILGYRRGGGTLKILAKNPKENSFIWDTTGISEGGNYYLELTASDGIIVTNKTIPIFVDRVSPVISSLTFSQKVFAGSGLLMATGLATDEMSGVEFIEYKIVPEVDNSNENESVWLKGDITIGFLNKNASFSIKEQLNFPDGVYRVFARAVDGSSNTSLEKSETILIDSTSPRIGTTNLSYHSASIFPTEGEFIIPLGAPLTISFSLEDDTKEANVIIDGVSYKLNKDQATNLWRADFSLSKIGTTTVFVTATDMLGNEGKDNNVAGIEAVSPGRIMYKEEDKILPVLKPKIDVRIYNPNRKTFSGFGSSVSSYGAPTYREGGEYYLALPRGTYQFIVSGEGFKQLKTDSFTLNEAQFIVGDFTLEKKISFWSMIKALFLK
ncbi:MAG: hypothetical protein AAB488_00990, partial [Patescibacteria group bacterium]